MTRDRLAPKKAAKNITDFGRPENVELVSSVFQHDYVRGGQRGRDLSSVRDRRARIEIANEYQRRNCAPQRLPKIVAQIDHWRPRVSKKHGRKIDGITGYLLTVARARWEP